MKFSQQLKKQTATEDLEKYLARIQRNNLLGITKNIKKSKIRKHRDLFI